MYITILNFFGLLLFFCCSGVGVCILWLVMSRESKRFVHMETVTDAFAVQKLYIKYWNVNCAWTLNEIHCVFWREWDILENYLWDKIEIFRNLVEMSRESSHPILIITYCWYIFLPPKYYLLRMEKAIQQSRWRNKLKVSPYATTGSLVR